MSDPDFEASRERLYADTPAPQAWTPLYERIGRERVASGCYQRAIEYRRDVLPALRTVEEALGGSLALLPSP